MLSSCRVSCQHTALSISSYSCSSLKHLKFCQADAELREQIEITLAACINSNTCAHELTCNYSNSAGIVVGLKEYKSRDLYI